MPMQLARFECPACKEAYVDELPGYLHIEGWPVHRAKDCGVDGIFLSVELTDEELAEYLGAQP